MAKSLTFHIHGPSTEPIDLHLQVSDDASPEQWLNQFADWMRGPGEVRDLPTDDGGEARIHFGRVWAVTYEPPAEVHVY